MKKIGKWVKPAAGFNVIATANTKGKGSEDGRFIGTNVLNEAFLERFPVTFEQSYPHIKIEEKMLRLHSASVGVHGDEFIKKLVDWADIIRKTFYDGVSRRSSQLVDLFISFVHMQSSRTKRKQLRIV